MAWPWRREQKALPLFPMSSHLTRTRSGEVQFGTVNVYVPYSVSGRDAAGGWTTSHVSRKDALSVPAVLRARNLIVGTLGGLPLEVHNPNREIVDPAQLTSANLLMQPEVAVPRSVTMARTFEDLLLDGIAWWRVSEWGWDNYPKRVRRLDPGTVQVRPDGTVWVGSQQVPDDQLIRFDSPNPGLLTAASRAINTCLRLDQAAARYADEPVPTGYFTPADGADPMDDEDVRDVLDAWQLARQQRSTGYVGGALRYTPTQYSAVDIQLAEARQHAVLEIARATGVDPEDLGVSTTTRTYQNGEDRRQALIDFSLSPLANAVQDRLSMGDVTPRGYLTRFKYEALVRGDTLARYQSYEVGLAIGAIGQDEVRRLEDKPDLRPDQVAKPPLPIPVVPKPTRAVPEA